MYEIHLDGCALNKWLYLDLVGEIHFTHVYEVHQDGRGPKQNGCIWILWHQIASCVAKICTSIHQCPFHSHIIVNMHFVVCSQCTLVHIWRPLQVTKSQHFGHVFVNVASAVTWVGY